MRDSRQKRFYRGAPARQPYLMQRRLEQGTITVPVPDHRELRIGTLQSIIRQSGLSRGLFETHA